MRIGIFGGTFDPPHLGHLILAAEARYQLKLDKLLFVLTPIPPHKLDRTISPLEDRLAMLDAAIADNPAFELSRVEIDRPGPHYSLDTVRLLRDKYPEDTLIYLMGGDSLRDLTVDWYKPDEFVAACDYLGVMRRPKDKIDLNALEESIPGISKKIEFMNAPLLEIASRQIRRRVAEGRPYCYYLPEVVCQIIQEKGLYQAKPT
ncbi:MAG: nicotinate-nucleotide adenylyltransferase [Anaerolineales bacterium]|jgi:nicotinate-nucleotide adenylyltransferase